MPGAAFFEMAALAGKSPAWQSWGCHLEHVMPSVHKPCFCSCACDGTEGGA